MGWVNKNDKTGLREACPVRGRLVDWIPALAAPQGTGAFLDNLGVAMGQHTDMRARPHKCTRCPVQMSWAGPERVAS